MKSLLFAGLLGMSFSAGSQFYDGNDMHKWIEADDRVAQGRSFSGDEDVRDSARLVGYVSAVSDFGNTYLFCFPNGARLGQVRDVISKYIKNHPEKRTEPALNLSVQALVQAFPCKNK